jgi:hypothetical protein
MQRYQKIYESQQRANKEKIEEITIATELL